MGRDDSSMNAAQPSRRQFLQGLAGATVAVAGSALIPENATPAFAEESAAEGEVSVQERPYITHECDALVIGGGIAGYAASLRLLEEGTSDIIVVDKARVGHSGASGMAWGHEFFTNEFFEGPLEETVKAIVFGTQGLVDQDNSMALAQEDHSHGAIAMNEQMGSIVMRFDDGNILLDPTAPLTTHKGVRIRQYAQYMRKLGIKIYDNTMIVDVVTDEAGHLAGAVGINLVDGSAHLFRCKTAVMAAGGFAHHSGCSVNGPEATGDGHAICLRHGAKLKDMEFYSYDMELVSPWSSNPDPNDDKRTNVGSWVFVNGLTGSRVYNKDGELYAKPFYESKAANEHAGVNFMGMITTSAMEMYAGRSVEGAGYGCYNALPDRGNGLFLDLMGYMDGHTFPTAMYQEDIRDVAEIGYEFTDQSGMGGDHNLQMAEPELYTSEGSPEVVAETGEIVAIPGLFYAMYCINELGTISAWSQGQLGGKSAAAAASVIDELPAFDPADVQAILNKSYAYLENEAEDPIRPTEIVNKIQSTFFHNLFMFRNEESITAAYNEFQRIWDEDLPRMACADRSRQFNRDWRNAMEVENMLLVSMASAKAALYRTETRPYHFRTDFPKMDNENWLVNVWVERSEDGEWTVSKTPVNDSIISASEISAILPPVDLDTGKYGE